MGLTKKTTILFPEDLYNHLKKVARSRRKSVGDLIRSACEKEYGLVSTDESMAAVESLGNLNLPAPSMEQMKAEIIAEKLMPDHI